jgi:hypothetical protein
VSRTNFITSEVYSEAGAQDFEAFLLSKVKLNCREEINSKIHDKCRIPR